MTSQDIEFSNDIQKLQVKIQAVSLPPDLLERMQSMIDRLTRMAAHGGYSSEYEAINRYIDWIVNLPWQGRSQDNLDLVNAKAVLDKNHYGLSQIKDRILEYLAVLSLQSKTRSDLEKGLIRAPILCLVGLVGTGKTTLGFSIAQALGRKFERIPFGGMGDSLTLRGQARAFADAEPGAVIKALRRAQTKNPVILLDEIDRVAEGARSDIMGVLIELLDPEQNVNFIDHFVDYPFDLSEVLFVATANNTTNISTAVLDRLEPLQMPSYSDEEKTTIAKSYVFPKAVAEAGLAQGQLTIADSVWPQIVRPLGFDSGIRTLERTIQGICRKVARMIVEGKGQTFTITPENVKEFLPTW
ncbi:AAA family ATPase [Candidatus Microgenomates bacterium]|nr:AAA family ATPase [Candidatus Microgenomates bacterium]